MIIFIFFDCNLLFVCYVRIAYYGVLLSFLVVRGYLTTVIFQQIAHKPTKFKKEFAAYIGEMYPVRLCLHVLPDASLHVCRWFLVGPVSECLGAFGFYLNVTKQAGFRSRKLWNRQAKLYFMGIPIMRTITATTAFKMPLHGISFLLSLKNTVL